MFGFAFHHHHLSIIQMNLIMPSVQMIINIMMKALSLCALSHIHCLRVNSANESVANATLALMSIECIIILI